MSEWPPPVLLALLLAGLAPAVSAADYDFMCKCEFPEPGDRLFPNIPDTFTAKYQWNMNLVNTSVYIEEYFSEPLNFAVTIVENMLGQPGQRSKLISDPEKQQSILIPNDNGVYGAECQVSPLIPNFFSAPFRKLNGSEHVLSGRSALMLGADSGFMLYQGTDTIDNIDVDVWTGCIYQREQDLRLNTTFYFTLNSTDDTETWKTPSGLKGSPKRVHFRGNSGDGKSPVDETYEFIYFSNRIPGDTVQDLELYQVPRGSYCKGRKTNMKLPKVPEFFSFKSEVQDPQQDLLTYTDEWYDFTSNLTRMDHEWFENRERVAAPVKMIHDYQTGLAYIIQKYTGICEIRAIEGTTFDDEIIPGAKTMVRMRNPKEFFNFDHDDEYPWVYEGGFVERGVTTDAWIAKRPFPTIGAKEMAYWEWYFTSSGWVVSNGDVDEQFEPFKLIITRPELDNQQTIYNIYEYNEEPPDERYFSVDECFDNHDGSRSYEFILLADVNKYNLDKHVGILRYYTAAAIEGFAEIRSLRIHRLEFIFDVDKVFVRFTMLGAPNNITGIVPNPVKQISLEDAERNLLSAVQGQRFIVVYAMPDGKAVTFTVDKDSLVKVEYQRGSNQSIYCVIDDDCKDKATAAPIVVPAAVSGGSAAAVAVTLLVVGLLLVGLGYYVTVVRRQKKLDNHRSGRLSLSNMNVYEEPDSQHQPPA